MFHNPQKYQNMPLGIVLRRSPGVTRWAAWTWRAVAVLPGAPDGAWQLLRQEGEIRDYHAATLMLELHGAETEAYLNALSNQPPCVFVVLRAGSGTWPYEPVLVTASAYEAQDYADSGEELVEKVEMPEGLVAWVRDFVEAHHHEEVFVKRRRDRTRIDLVEDGVGDPRIAQLSDVYRAPSAQRKGRLQ